MINSQFELKIKKMFENGFSIKRISIILNIDNKIVKSFIENNNISLQHRIFTPKELPKIINLYEEGVSAKNLAIIYQIDRRRIFKYLECSKTNIKTASEGRRNFHFNEKFFDKIDTAEKAYWFGFLMADGCNQKSINTVYISLKGDDKLHLEKFAKILKYSVNKVTIQKTKYNDKPYYIANISLYSKHLCEILEKKGCVPNKSLIAKFPYFLNEKLYSHYIRGLFDGDGCLTFYMDGNYKQYKWGITSTYEMLKPIKDYLSDNLNIYVNLYNTSKTGKNTWSIECSGNLKIKKVLNWLYKGSRDNIRLNRKYERYIECINIKRKKPVVLSDNDINDICNLRKNHVAINKIAAKYKVASKRIKKILKENNIVTKRFDNFNIMNEKIFDSISSNDSAYALGAVWSKINSKYKDIDLSIKKISCLKKLSNILYYDEKFVKTYFSKGNNQYCRLSINNQNLQNKIKDIIEKGVVILHTEYYTPFLQGCIDFNGRYSSKYNCFKVKIHKNLSNILQLILVPEDIVKIKNDKKFDIIYFKK